jgi:hypothetical protein
MKPMKPLLLALAAAAAAPAGASDYAYMLSAGEMRSMIEQNPKGPLVLGYISGVMDAQMRAREFCLPDAVTLADVGVRAFKLMGQQPRESKAPAADVIAVYLHGDFPCRK